MPRSLKVVGLAIVVIAFLVGNVVMLVDGWRDAGFRLESYRQAKSEWTLWIESSCELPTNLALLISDQLADWPFAPAPSDVLFDFEQVRNFEARALSKGDTSIVVPAELAEFIIYRFDWAMKALPEYDRKRLSIDVIDNCAESVAKALVAFEKQVQEDTDQFFDDEVFDEWRELGILRKRNQ